MAILISGIESTELFVGSRDEPRQVVRVYLAQEDLSPRGGPVRVSISGSGVSTPEPTEVSLGPGERNRAVEVGIVVPEGAASGTVLRVIVSVEGDFGRVDRPDPITIAEPGWTMYMVSHFHFDPVWWNTQSNYTEDWKGWAMPRLTFQTSAFGLMDEHIAHALRDPDYTFVIAELDYLKPYWDSRPEQRGTIRRLLAEGRLEVMGGTYNEPSTNLSGIEATARSAVYGAGFQRGVMGADPQSAWQLDVFGHDPQFPSLMASAGLTSTAWARGPFHQNGPTFDYLGDYPLFFSRTGPFRGSDTIRDPKRMQFPSEFEWISPSGAGLMTSYMHNHYLSGWSIDAAATLEEAEASAYELFLLMKQVTATKNLILPFGTDFAIPSQWVTDIHRDWARKYVWPRFITGIPRDFFAAVRAELAAEGRVLTPQTRDMNPVWTGKDVSLIDTKQAQRAIETALVDAEKFATLAALRGAPYPESQLDLAWRQVFFGAHHDAVTGTGSDQVYVDLLGSWREASDIALSLRAQALTDLSKNIDTSGGGVPLVVANPLAIARTDVVHADVIVPWGDGGFRLLGPDDQDVAFVVDDLERSEGCSTATITFVATDVPSLGVAVHRLVADSAELPQWRRDDSGLGAENAHFSIEIDPSRGGALSRITHRGTGKELLAKGRVGSEILVYGEYPQHPNMGEGPWMLVPNGDVVGAAEQVAHETWTLTSPVGTVVGARGKVDDVLYVQTHTLWNGVDRVDGTTRVEQYGGSDKLVRLRLPAAVHGGRPVVEVGEAVIGRAFGYPDVDSAIAPWTLDTPSNRWFGLGSTARVVAGSGAERRAEALGVAEVVIHAPDDPVSGARDLVVALASVGVTATVTAASGPRYGNLDVDSNLPDVRIAVGHPDDNSFVESVLDSADPAYRTEFDRQLQGDPIAILWVPAQRTRQSRLVPMADLRGIRDLPVLIAAGAGGAGSTAAVSALIADLADATIELPQPVGSTQLEGLEEFSVGVINRGTPGSVVDASGALHLSLLRSSTGWPSGVWIDPPRRTVPDGSSFHEQHWTHDFEYSIIAGSGDWREAGFVAHGHAFNHPLASTVADSHEGEIPRVASLLSVEPADRVNLVALKLAGNPIAEGRTVSGTRRGITLRLTETSGASVDAVVNLPGGWVTAQRANLLEKPIGELPITGTELRVRIGAAEIATITGLPAGTPVATRSVVSTDGASHYSRYWLHNRGAAPGGFVPVSVHFARRTAPGGAQRSVDVTIASNRVETVSTGSLELVIPPGWTVNPREYEYRVPPGGYVSVPVTITAADDATPGTYGVTARISDSEGSVVEDIVRVVVDGGRAVPQEASPELEIEVVEPQIALRRGAPATGSVRLRNMTPGTISAELHVIAPFAAWAAVDEPRVFVHLDAGEERTVSIPLFGRIPRGTYWILPKLMWNGEVAYAPSIPLVVSE
jgi:alpha-mannosidase